MRPQVFPYLRGPTKSCVDAGLHCVLVEEEAFVDSLRLTICGPLRILTKKCKARWLGKQQRTVEYNASGHHQSKNPAPNLGKWQKPKSSGSPSSFRSVPLKNFASSTTSSHVLGSGRSCFSRRSNRMMGTKKSPLTGLNETSSTQHFDDSNVPSYIKKSKFVTPSFRYSPMALTLGKTSSHLSRSLFFLIRSFRCSAKPRAETSGKCEALIK